MNKRSLTAALLAGAAALWLVRPFEPARELPAGTALADGTVAGEKQALAYFRANDAELSAALEGLHPAARRAKYGRYFVWFQRAGGYRTGQKADMARRLRLSLGLPAQAGGDQAYEWPAGTILEDGTTAGEAEAMDFFRASAPDLARRLGKLDAKVRRERFGEKFAWFQRVGNYRRRQKAEMVRQIRDELDAEALSRAVRAARGARREAPAAELRARLADAYDSQTGLIEFELLSLDEELGGLARRPVVWLFQPGELLTVRSELRAARERLAARRASRDAALARRFAEASGGG